MARKKTESIRVRMTPSEVKTLRLIMSSAGLEDTSEAVRFCITFTKTMLTVVPASAGEALLSLLEEDLVLQENV